MWLTCKKTYFISNYYQLIIGKKYKVLTKSKFNDKRYWFFEVDAEAKLGQYFIVDEYFITPEEERNSKINQLLDEV